MFWVRNRQMPRGARRLLGTEADRCKRVQTWRHTGSTGDIAAVTWREGAPDVTEALEETAAAVSTGPSGAVTARVLAAGLGPGDAGPSPSALQSVSDVLQLTTVRSDRACV